MKKLLLIIACIFIANLTMAQDDKEDNDKKWPNGFRAGYQWSNLVKEEDKVADNLDGFYVGYLRKVKIIPLLRLETGLEYMIAGAQTSDDKKLRLHYLVLPAQLVVKIGPVYGLAGVNGNIKIYEDLKVNGQKVDITSENRVSAFDIAVDAGAGFNFLFLSIEARYYWGLLEVEQGYKNQYAQIGLKVHF